MAIRYPDVLDICRTVEVSWSERDTMLYALGLGAGDDPLNGRQLRFVTEFGLCALPTMAATLALGATPAMATGFDYRQAVHGGQVIRMHRPLSAAGHARASSRVLAVQDKGLGRGAVLIFETALTDAISGEPIATLESTAFARGDGGFGGPDTAWAPPHAMPSRRPDETVVIPTRPDQALLYRLSGDYNPLHALPEVAHAAGFDAPILHGLCTYGIAARAILTTYADEEPATIVSHAARFSAPVFPGDVLEIDLWRDDLIVSFEVRVPARALTVIKSGRTELVR